MEIEDFANYDFLDNEFKYVYYNHNLYILAKEESDYIRKLTTSKLRGLTFSKASINQFSNGLFNRVKNNIVISEDVTEVALPTKPDVKLYFDISYSKLKCDIVLAYKDREINYFDKTDFLRDNDYEQEVVADILSYNFIEEDNSFIMTDQDEMYAFLDEELAKLSEKYQVFTSKKIDNTKILKGVSTSNNFSIGKEGIMSYKFSADVLTRRFK